MPEETAYYNGKKYRKLKSLAPVEILKDIHSECEKANFNILKSIYMDFFSEIPLSKLVYDFSGYHACPEWLPWLIQKGYIEEVRDERNEHRAVFKKFLRDRVVDPSYPLFDRIWDYFDQHPIPKKQE